MDFMDHFTDVKDGILDFANNSEYIGNDQDLAEQEQEEQIDEE